MPAAELALHVLLDGERLDRKLTALSAMASQTRDLMAVVDPAIYASQVAEESFVDACHLGVGEAASRPRELAVR